MTPPERPREFRSFELLLGELQGCLAPDHFERVRVVLSSWGGQQINVPAPRRWLIESARQAALRAFELGAEAPAVRLRLVAMGVSERTAYRIVATAKKAPNGAT